MHSVFWCSWDNSTATVRTSQYLDYELWLVHPVFFIVTEIKPLLCNAACWWTNGVFYSSQCVFGSSWCPNFVLNQMTKAPPTPRPCGQMLIMTFSYLLSANRKERQWPLFSIFHITGQNIPGLPWFNTFSVDIEALTSLTEDCALAWGHPSKLRKVTPTSKFWLHLYFLTLCFCPRSSGSLILGPH